MCYVDASYSTGLLYYYHIIVKLQCVCVSQLCYCEEIDMKKNEKCVIYKEYGTSDKECLSNEDIV